MAVRKNFIFHVSGNSIPPTPPVGTFYFVCYDNDPSLYIINSLGVRTRVIGNSSSSSSSLITDTAIISAITNPSNWDDTGQWGGGAYPTGLIDGNYYIDTDTSLKYEYLNNILMRIPFNRDTTL